MFFNMKVIIQKNKFKLSKIGQPVLVTVVVITKFECYCILIS
jgi:hypothetical protein